MELFRFTYRISQPGHDAQVHLQAVSLGDAQARLRVLGMMGTLCQVIPLCNVYEFKFFLPNCKTQQLVKCRIPAASPLQAQERLREEFPDLEEAAVLTGVSLDVPTQIQELQPL